MARRPLMHFWDYHDCDQTQSLKTDYRNKRLENRLVGTLRTPPFSAGALALIEPPAHIDPCEKKHTAASRSPSMKVFISYPHTNAEMAESLATRLKAEGHEVFWDRTSLPSGESFDDRIRDGIDASDLFICLLTKASLSEGKYARTELKFAQEKWPNPSGRVLPVTLDDAAMASIPAYLKSVTIEQPEGDAVAEVAAEVRRIARRPMRRFMIATRLVIILAVITVVGWLAFRGLPGNPIRLTMGMKGAFYKESIESGTQALNAATDYTRLFERGLRGSEHVDGEKLLAALDQDETGPGDANTSPLPVLSFRIANNSGETIIVDRLRLSVRKSRIDERPLLWSSSTMRHTNSVINASFALGNDGWGPAENIRFAFDIVSESDLPGARNASARRFDQGIESVAQGRSVVAAFWDMLAAFGTEVSFLRDGPHPMENQQAMRRFDRDVAALRKAIGATGDEPIFAVGELSYTWGDGRSERLSLRQRLQIVYPGPILAPAMMATAEYEIALLPEGADYVRDRVIAHSIAPGGVEAINLRVWVEKSSFHEMTAAIRVGEKWIAAGDKLRLEHYRPIHSAWVEGEKR